MKNKSFWDIYDEITQDTQRWNYFSAAKPEHTAQDLFSGQNALKYIQSTFILGGKEKALDIINDPRFQMTQYRSNHTLSAYLFGIALQEKMHIDMRALPKITNEPRKNFLYFWSLTCLYHDFAFSLEEETRKENNAYLPHLSSIHDFIDYFHIKYSLLDKSPDSKLISNYYQYIVDCKKCVDHGIAGAMLFYDEMMKEYHSSKALSNVERSATFEHNGKKFSKDFEKHIVLIANTIAKHNMWRAKSDSMQDFERYELFELIPSEDNSHLVSLYTRSEHDKEKLLFLLGLVDTLEPIKVLGRKKNLRQLTNPYLVLEKIKIEFLYRQKIKIYCPREYINDYYNSIASMEDWLNVSIQKDPEVITIYISQDNCAQKDVA